MEIPDLCVHSIDVVFFLSKVGCIHENWILAPLRKQVVSFGAHIQLCGVSLTDVVLYRASHRRQNQPCCITGSTYC